MNGRRGFLKMLAAIVPASLAAKLLPEPARQIPPVMYGNVADRPIRVSWGPLVSAIRFEVYGDIIGTRKRFSYVTQDFSKIPAVGDYLVWAEEDRKETLLVQGMTMHIDNAVSLRSDRISEDGLGIVPGWTGLTRAE